MVILRNSGSRIPRFRGLWTSREPLNPEPNNLTIYNTSLFENYRKRKVPHSRSAFYEVTIKFHMASKDISISSPIEEKIAWAEACYQKFGRQLLADKTVADLLDRVKRAIHASHAEMKKTGIIALCQECEQEEGGSCCGAGMENRYGGRLILINLLLNVSIRQTRRDSKSCYFLGEEGCLLQARHVICINYICRKISDRIDPVKISALREKEGEEVNLLFLLHEHVKKSLKGQAA